MSGETVKIYMVRHGESEWNALNQFCGWFDANLSEAGEKEAHQGGKALKDAGVHFDEAHSSLLKRANTTLDIILEELGVKGQVPVYKTWRLNERHYGDLTGQNKKSAVEKFGAEQVQIWRRSFAVPPPAMEESNPYYEAIQKNPLYADIPAADLPVHESLELTIKRTLPYWNEAIVPKLKENKSILIAAHGNSLRGIVMHLDNMTEEDIMELNLPTGIPFYYELSLPDLKVVKSLQFLGDEETVKAAMDKVAAQTTAKK